MNYKQIVNSIIEELIRAGVVNKSALRDFEIKQRYHELLQQKDDSGCRKYTHKQVRNIVAEERNREHGDILSDKRIQAIIYSRANNDEAQK